MKIASSSVLMGSSHISQQEYERKERLIAWIGNRQPDSEGSASVPRAQPASNVQISQAGAAAQAPKTNAIEEGIKAAENDPILQILRAMIALLTGEEVRVFSASDLAGDNPPAPAPQQPSAPSDGNNSAAQPQPAGYGVEYDRQRIL